MNTEYFLILMGFLALALTIELGLKFRVYASFRERLTLTLVYFGVGVVWDTFALARGHWAFPVGGTMGPRIGLMPIEEYLFLLIVPYSMLAVRALVIKSLKR